MPYYGDEEPLLPPSSRSSREFNGLPLPNTPQDQRSGFGAFSGRFDSDLRVKSVILPFLEEKERHFFNLVGSGDVDEVAEFLSQNPDFNINCVDFQGLSALHIAVLAHSESMVNLLLSREDIDVGDCVLHAVRENQPKLVLSILEKSPTEATGCLHSTDFPLHMTPLVLAAQCGHFELISMLLQRGHRIHHPHPPDCFCKLCQVDAEQDGLEVAISRLDYYRAIINPAYICHISDDPILTAFQLCQELKRWACVDGQFRVAYNEMAKEARAFPVELLGCCRRSTEVETILKRREGYNIPGQVHFPRLMMAIDYVQKEFVAHPNTQQVLDTAWAGNWFQWRTRSDLYKVLSVFPRIVMLPVIMGMVMVAPRSRYVQHWSLPINKLISYAASYVVFIAVVFTVSNADKTKQPRGPPQSGLEIALLIFVLSFMWSSARLFLIQGPRRFLSVLTNWYDLIMYLFFVLTFVFWLSALLDACTTEQSTLPREYWHYLDPTLLAEGWMAIASIMAVGRLMFLCQLNYHLGPLFVAIGKMTRDFAKYVIIFALLVLSFTAGLCRLYQAYDGMTQEDKTSGTKISQVSSFVSPGLTLKTLFWAIFCMSPVESADVVIKNLPGTDTINRHYFTQTIGYVSFALFEVISVIVMLNMLIATISSTFQKVTDNVDIEWTFGKTEVYLGYLSQTTLPPPFNLLPTPSGLSYVIGWFKALIKRNPERKARFSLSHCCYLEEEKIQDEKDFPALMSQLVQRYFRENDREP